MTEAQWLLNTHPSFMLEHLGTRADKRRCMLFVCACERRLWNERDCEREKVEATERYADGQLTAGELLGYLRNIEDDSFQVLWVVNNVGTVRWAIAESLDSAAFVADVVLRERALKEGRTIKSLEAERAREAAYHDEQAVQSGLLRDIFGNPFRPVTLDPSWLTRSVVGIGEAIYVERAFDRLPILADALEEAGCTNLDVLNHCRKPGEHVRGCWVVDGVLAKQ